MDPRGPTDSEQLLDFLDRLERGVLAPLCTTHVHLLRVPDLALVGQVWEEIQQFTIAPLRDWLSARAADLVQTKDQALARVGLGGLQLELKLGAFRRSLDRRFGTARNAVVRWFREALAWANVILGSLALAFPSAEPLKEFKEFLETGLDYSGAAARHRA